MQFCLQRSELVQHRDRISDVGSYEGDNSRTKVQQHRQELHRVQSSRLNHLRLPHSQGSGAYRSVVLEILTHRLN